VIVADTPNWAERDAKGYGYGGGNRVMLRLLQREGVSRNDVHWSAAVPCECEWSALPAARKACAARLRAEVLASGAEVVMPTGALALQSLLELPRKPDMTRWRGSVCRVSEKGVEK
jgi:uracil-DNA glycosylase